MITVNFTNAKAEQDFKNKIKEIYGDIAYVNNPVIILPEVGMIHTSPLFSYDFTTKTNGILTNEYAHWNPTDPKAKVSAEWDMTSGSLFVKGGLGWTGVPDDKKVDILSATGNNSAVFRLTTKRKDFKDVSVKFKLINIGLNSTPTTPPVDWDGLHVFLRYQTEQSLYYASVNRRDGKSIIKKKVPGGPSNGGTYYDLTPSVSHPWVVNAPQNVEASIKTLSDGSVLITLLSEGKEIVKAVDDGKIGGPPILLAGMTGIRGDNCQFTFKDFSVTAV